MVISKHSIRDGNIATCYMFKDLYPPESWKERYVLGYYTYQSVAFSEGSNNFMGTHQCF